MAESRVEQIRWSNRNALGERGLEQGVDALGNLVGRVQLDEVRRGEAAELFRVPAARVLR
jgi:hypothetical protein